MAWKTTLSLSGLIEGRVGVVEDARAGQGDERPQANRRAAVDRHGPGVENVVRLLVGDIDDPSAVGTDLQAQDIAACRQLPVELDPGPLGAGDGDAVELDLAGGLLGDGVDDALAVGADLEGVDGDAAGQGAGQADRRAAGDANAPKLPGFVDRRVVDIDGEVAIGAQLRAGGSHIAERQTLAQAVRGGGRRRRGGGESRQEREGGNSARAPFALPPNRSGAISIGGERALAVHGVPPVRENAGSRPMATDAGRCRGAACKASGASWALPGKADRNAAVEWGSDDAPREACRSSRRAPCRAGGSRLRRAAWRHTTSGTACRTCRCQSDATAVPGRDRSFSP